MNGRESAVGTYLGYQLRGATVNRNRRRLRCKKKELWIIDDMLWKSLWAAVEGATRVDAPPPWPSPASRERGQESAQAGDKVWMTRVAIISRVFAA